MKKLLAILLSIIVAGVQGYGQTDNDLYRQTVSFLKLLTYGEHSQDIGLKFTWRQNDGKWEPCGNGFVFLSEGLGVYDYETESNLAVPTGSLWKVDDKACLADAGRYTLMNDENDLVRFVDSDSTKTDREPMVAPVYIELYELCSVTDSVIPAKITSAIAEDATGKFDFVAFLDREDGLLIFRMQNLHPYEMTVYIDNSPFPASRFGVMTQTVLEAHESAVVPVVGTIEMKGRLTLPPYSVTFFKFATRQFPDTTLPR